MVNKTVAEALKQDGSHMFGKSILVSPVMDSEVSQWRVYLPENPAGWYDAARTLNIEGRQGSFEGMAAERTFTANLLGTTQTVTYDGSSVALQF